MWSVIDPYRRKCINFLEWFKIKALKLSFWIRFLRVRERSDVVKNGRTGDVSITISQSRTRKFEIELINFTASSQLSFNKRFSSFNWKVQLNSRNFGQHSNIWNNRLFRQTGYIKKPKSITSKSLCSAKNLKYDNLLFSVQSPSKLVLNFFSLRKYKRVNEIAYSKHSGKKTKIPARP